LPDLPAVYLDRPIGVGGVGGSGTRLIAGVLQKLGFYLGHDINESLDNLWFTLLFKRPEALNCSDEDFAAFFTIFRKAMTGCDALSETEIRLVREAAEVSRVQHDSAWLSQRAESLISECAGRAVENRSWAWKDPNTHVVLPRLKDLAPEVRYIHVVRNGLDMAYSQNQNQLITWGPRFLGGSPATVNPRSSLKYWVAAHRRILEISQRMSNRFLMVNYDLLCADPARELPRIVEFLGFETSSAKVAAAAALVRPSSGIGRFKAFPRDHFDADDIAFVESAGFDTEWQT
jgi:Sulfotransferase family